MTEIDRFAELKRVEEAARAAFGDGTAALAVETGGVRLEHDLEDALAGR